MKPVRLTQGATWNSLRVQSPKAIYGVGIELRVMTHDTETFNDGLRGKEPVKRISMMKREEPGVNDMIVLDR